MELKKCKWCDEEKPLSDFYRTSPYKDGRIRYRPECKMCHNIRKNQNFKTKRKIKRCIFCGNEFLAYHYTTHKICSSKICKQLYSKIYNLIRNYGKIAVVVMKKYKFKCAINGCKNINNKIALHHIDWNEVNNVEENLIPFCTSHHASLHNFILAPKAEKIKWFGEWMQSVNQIN